MARRELIDRWRTGNIRTEVLRRLADGRSLLDLELPVVDGLLDLRGFPAGGLDSRSATIAGVDFRYATLAHAHLEDVRFSGCRFDGADLARAVFTDGSITECMMVRATLRETLLARTTWRSVNLTGAKMNHFSAERTSSPASPCDPAYVKRPAGPRPGTSSPTTTTAMNWRTSPPPRCEKPRSSSEPALPRGEPRYPVDRGGQRIALDGDGIAVLGVRVEAGGHGLDAQRHVALLAPATTGEATSAHRRSN